MTLPKSVISGALAIGLLAAAAPAVTLAQPSLAAEKALVDQAKSRGEVGEQADGYLGLVHGGADAAVAAAVNDINAGRRRAYADAGARTGVSADAAAAAAARQLIARTPAGQYYRDAGGGWARK